MDAYVVKVKLGDGDLLPPISAMAASKAAAEALVRDAGIAGSKGSVEAKEIRSDVMAKAFGPQLDGTIVIRSDWTWSNEEPAPKKPAVSQ